MSETRKIKPSLSKGTRDFLPQEVTKRNYIFDIIKSVFRKYGFQEIETPAIEKLETLTGKYGEEGDKLLFKILNSGDYLKDIPADKLQRANSRELLNDISEKGLRYDLTVPLARYVVMHQDELPMPFKRFHIGPVWRADRPQKGRYQEFYQCDADVIGSSSLLNEVELTMIYAEVFNRLGINIVIYYNHRKVFDALGEIFQLSNRLEEFTVIIDKLDKIGWDGVFAELARHFNLSEQQIRAVFGNELRGTIHLESWFQNTKHGAIAYKELSDYERKMSIAIGQFPWQVKIGSNVRIEPNPTLARGLSYYTGLIWEVSIDWKSERNEQIRIGSLGGGGRYDNLTEIFGGQNMSGVGISFGIERIYDVMEELNLFPETIETGVQVLFVPRNEAVEEFTFRQTQALRDAGIGAEIFLGNVKKQKQLKYAGDKNILYIIEVGEDERQTGLFRMRDTRKRETGEFLPLSEIISVLQKAI